jgi:hypothetical protein
MLTCFLFTAEPEKIPEPKLSAATRLHPVRQNSDGQPKASVLRLIFWASSNVEFPGCPTPTSLTTRVTYVPGRTMSRFLVWRPLMGYDRHWPTCSSGDAGDKRLLSREVDL